MKKYSLVFVGCFLFMLGCKAEKVKGATDEKLSTPLIEISTSEIEEGASEIIEVKPETVITDKIEENVSEQLNQKEAKQPKIINEVKSVEKEVEVKQSSTTPIDNTPSQEEVKISDNVDVAVSTDKKFAEAEKSEEKEVEKQLIKSEVEKKVEIKEPIQPVVSSHEVFNSLLAKYVSQTGVVDYAGLKSEIATLDGYLSELSSNAPSNSWSSSKKLAYWINAYNAFTLKLILDNYPLSSITNLHGGKPWDKKWIEIGGKTYSLNNIENDIIRPTFNEPRIHFAVNCAAISCPKLGNFAFTEDNLEKKLEENTVAFINGAQNSISSDQVTVSKIFDWYGADFGNLVDFLNKYSNTKISTGTKVKFAEYDWNLNGK